MSKSFFPFLFFYCFGTFNGIAQDATVGSIFHNDGSKNNLTLFSPVATTTTYLIDNCGYIYNSWVSDSRPGLSAYLDKDGNLYRAGRAFNPTFANGGGLGGIVEKFNYEGDLEWQISITDDSSSMHHDIELLPNGNILVLIWELISEEKAESLGRNPEMVNERGFWIEVIKELKVTSTDNFEVVWEWSLMDHFVQFENESLPNFGLPSDYPQKIDINLFPREDGVIDFLHINSIDYHPEKNQILLSSRNLSEIFIIDKSTSTQEAKTDQGGDTDRGGGLIFRWGNPQNYSNDTTLNQSLFSQHDARFINEGLTDNNNISVFNNGNQRDGFISYSSVEEITFREDGLNYDFIGREATQSNDIVWSYVAEDTLLFFSKNMAGAQRLSNGNTLVTEATKGRIFEVTLEKEIVREYINPVNSTGPVAQFELAPGNTVFKAISYDFEYFDDEVFLTRSFSRIELNPTNNCNPKTSVNKISAELDFTISNLGSEINVWSNELKSIEVQVFSLSSIEILGTTIMPGQNKLNLSPFPSGIYFIRFTSNGKHSIKTIFLP